MAAHAKLDPRLSVVLDEAAGAADNADAAVAVVEAAARMRLVRDERTPPDAVEVLIRCPWREGIESVQALRNMLANAGVEVRSIVEGPEFVVAGAVSTNNLLSLADQYWVAEVEAARQLFPELDHSIVDARVRSVHLMPSPRRGRAMLVGIIDTGIDFAHDDFRHPDGTSRILFLWDQRGPAVAGGRVPFGREYRKAELDAALRTAPPPVPVTHKDVDGHGTHVAGIAAGNGRSAAGMFLGVAPDADLIIVAARGGAATLGQSNDAIAAYQYIVDRAAEQQRPVAINQSQGMNGGGHSGESLLEVAMDNLARRTGVAIVKSAGNEQEWRIHAGGRLSQGATVVLEFESSGSNVMDDILELWHDGIDQIAVAVQPPGGATPMANDFVVPGAQSSVQSSAGNRIRIDSKKDASDTGDVQTAIFISPGTAARIQPGTWRMHLRGDQIKGGRYDVWIERSAEPRPSEQARFRPGSEDPTATISIPGTARRVITVGAYVTRAQGGITSVGQLSTFSSHGPTRYGLAKPEIAAPGQEIVAPRSSASNRPAFQPGYTRMPGTSMAAPHVTGAAALLFEINPEFTCEQIKQILMRAARRDGFAASAPDGGWGSGRLDVQRAVDLARDVRFPVISGVTVNGTRIEWQTDIPTTGAVRFNTHARRLLLGRASGSRADLSMATRHSLDLGDLPSGTYLCEVLAFTAQDWWTLEDDDGGHYQVTVP